MPEWVIAALPQVFSGACLLFVGWAGGELLQAKRNRTARKAELDELKALRADLEADAEKREALYKGMKASLRKDLVDAYGEYVTDGKTLTVERMHEITEGYNAYRALGGNGTGKAMYEGICEVPIEIIK